MKEDYIINMRNEIVTLVVKQDGKCGTCKQIKTSVPTIEKNPGFDTFYYCTLFSKDLVEKIKKTEKYTISLGIMSCEECNKKYGETYNPTVVKAELVSQAFRELLD